jgi:Xaa-Pro aminopeptidase
MKNELDALMQSNGIDGLLITGPAMHNPAMVYMIGVAHVSGGDLIKRRGAAGVLFHGVMEREEAAKSGLRCVSYSQYPWADLYAEANQDLNLAMALRYQRMFAEAGLTSGRVAVYGMSEVGAAISIFKHLERLMPNLELVGFARDELLMQAQMTKDPGEVDRIRHMGKITTEVVGRTAEYITRGKPVNGIMTHQDGKPLTIGEVRGKINLFLAELGAENPEATIFAIGRDAGIPHSIGTDSDVIRLGKPIVFDIYPCEAGGGYFYDFTRTWCLGYAPDDVQKLYEDVRTVFTTLLRELEVGAPFKRYQARTCELFEQMGHPTIATNPQAEEGYIHSLGHGVGLNIHEKPFSGASAADTDCLLPGTVFTVEPGLYYPSRGMGIRLEDTLYTRPDGKFEILAPYPLDLVLPVKGS